MLLGSLLKRVLRFSLQTYARNLSLLKPSMDYMCFSMLLKKIAGSIACLSPVSSRSASDSKASHSTKVGLPGGPAGFGVWFVDTYPKSPTLELHVCK